MTAATQVPHSSGAAVKWLHAYRQMIAIRLFEEQVNDLYTRAIMPGLAHLYIGEEAVAAQRQNNNHDEFFSTSSLAFEN